MHDDLVRQGRRRLLAAAAAGIGLLAVSVALVLLPFVWAGVWVADVLRGGGGGWAPFVRAAVLCGVLGALTGSALFAVSLVRSEHRVTETVGVRPRTGGHGREEQVRNLVDGLAIAAGVSPPTTAVIPDPAPNCLTVGRGPGTAWLVMTTGLLDALPRDELEAVLAFEMGRIAARSVSLDTVVYAATGVAFGVWVGAFDGLDELSLVLVPVAVIATPLIGLGVLLRRAAMRSQARISDGLAVSYCRNPAALLAALRRLEADGRVVRTAEAGSAYLWFVYPHTRWSRLVLGSGRVITERRRRLERALGEGS